MVWRHHEVPTEEGKLFLGAGSVQMLTAGLSNVGAPRRRAGQRRDEDSRRARRAACGPMARSSSDRESNYTANDFTKLNPQLGLVQSMGAVDRAGLQQFEMPMCSHAAAECAK